jgi:Zn-dependent protease
MRGSLRIGKIAGINIEIHYSWLVIFLLVTVTLAIGWFPTAAPGHPVALYWLLGVVVAVIFFASVLVHELAHSLVAKAGGTPVQSITLFMLGGASNIERDPRSPRDEFLMALVGPLTNLVLGGLLWLLGAAIGPGNRLVAAFLGYLVLANLLVGLFNLIPGFPLDGGRVLRAILWKITGNLRTATRYAAATGQVVGMLFLFAGFWLLLSSLLLDGIWLGLIGLFLMQAARAESAQSMLTDLLGDARVAEFMSPPPPTAPANISLQRLVDEYIVRYGLSTVPVEQVGILVGFVTLADVRQVPTSEWPLVPVGQAMTPLARLQVVTPDQPIQDALTQLERVGARALPVVQEGQLLGMLSAERVGLILEIRRQLGLGRTPISPPEHADIA